MKKALAIVGEKNEGKSCGISTCAPVQKEPVRGAEFQGRVAVVTLGCAKNQVDSEVMLGVLQKKGFELVNDVKEADLAIVNTCGFLESAVKESLDCILDLAELKTNGRLRQLIVAGCMVERYQGDLKKTLPEVDHFISPNDLLSVGDVAQGNAVLESLDRAARPYFLYDDTMPRCLSTRSHTAYVKISEGCNRPCTFCIIPKIRGTMRSRSIDSVVREVTNLVSGGVREINLVAQDLTSYGLDRKERGLADLLRELDRTGIDWVRLLYAYPIGIDKELLQTISSLNSVCDYLDLPLQHASEAVLKNMKRPLGRYSPRSIAELVAKEAPSISMRTTFIVGFPGERDEDVAELESFIREGHFSSVGIFTYSAEEGTPAHDMSGHISAEEKDERRARLMLAQQEVVAERLSRYIGQTIPVLVEGTHEDSDLLISARSRFQAPEVDGVVIINDINGCSAVPEAGTIAQVEITEIAGYDLIGTLRSSSEGH